MTLPLIPNTDFGNVALWTTDLAYLAFNQVRDGQTQYLGHHPLILDSELDTGSGSILARVSAVTDPFKVAQVGTTGSVITWQAGQFRLPSSSVITISSSQISLPADSTNYIYVNSSGVVTYSTGSTDTIAFTGIPVIRHILAKVVVVASNISAITDMRAVGIRGSNPPSSVIKTFGGQSNTDITVTAGQVLSGTVYCRNFVVPAGITCSVKYSCRVVCSGSFTNNGTINVNKFSFGAPTFFTILARASGSSGGLPGSGLGTRGISYDPSIQNSSSGGSLGVATLPSTEVVTNGYAAIGAGGDAGGTLIVEAFGYITQNGTIIADGGNAAASSTTTDGTTFKAIISGSGGGAGGLVSFTSLTGITCTATSVTSVKGGNGGAGLCSSGGAVPLYAVGGNGGGGGYIVLNTPGTLTTTGATFTLTGGAPGAMGNFSSAVTVVSGTSYKVQNTTYGIGGTAGAGFGGDGGTVTGQSTDATYTYFTLNSGNSGQLVTSSALPLS